MPDEPRPGGPMPLRRPPGLPDLGGEPACWLASVCPACGAFNEGPTNCWNCGRPPDGAGPGGRPTT